MVSRRDFLKASIVASATRSRPRGAPLHVAVVGAGAFGGWTALHLRRSGANVTLIDAWGPGNTRASSGATGIGRPAIGEILARHIREDSSPDPFFALARFAGKRE